MGRIELQPQDVTHILTEHHQFFDTNETLELDFRLEQLTRLREGILRYEEKINEALHKDLGKHPFETYTSEIGFVLNSIRHAKKQLKKWAKPKKVKTPPVLFPSKSMILYEPYGTVLIIGPYNYPFQLLIEPMIGAIAAGNCVVLKPSEAVPHVSGVIEEMIQSIFDPSYIRCVQGGIETNTSLIHSRFDYIFFTGSVQVGKIVMEAASKNLVPVTLELGGKSPVIVDESADIRVAANRIIWGKTLNSGQTCVAPDYLLVHESVKKTLVEEMKNVLQSFFGDNIESSKDFGRIVNDKHFTRLKTIIERDQSGILFGGGTNPETRFIEPTLIEADWDSASMKDEIFGPILPVLTYKDLDKAIASIKKLSKPLALYLFTSKDETEKKVLREVSSGGVSINDTVTHLANPELPFGGVGHSGIGAYHGYYSFTAFSHEKSILKKSSKVNLSTLFPPYTDKKLELIRRLLK
ncbi:aldehyde dehydrogenase [Mesobacillus foraminis]|uniref:aldehyde dehydrogenase n=1 Tax=Mesobacillus foraminis TaxID=279826 RepID=UPI001BEA9E11|nr:aldehyde dehydrogenase [Mesobacillus foraminis]MBT2755155.1 aldehyde dehydrogenase [Mesobacillus foraminis]